MKLVLDLCEAKINLSGNISAPIFLRLHERAFPEEGWIDFPIVILSWWLSSIESFEDPIELAFMDGPFAIRLKMDANLYEYSCIEDGKKMIEPSFSGRIRKLDFVKDLNLVSQRAVQFCRDRNIVNDDVETLAQHVASCRIQN